MHNFQRISRDFAKSLSLQYEAVGVALYKLNGPVPDQHLPGDGG